MTVLKEWRINVAAEEGRPDREDRSVLVQRHDDEVVVVWVCGATRRFKPADLRRALDLFDIVTANDGSGDLWYHDWDSPGNPYHARLDNGNFMADEGAVDDAYRVPWEEFSTALKAAITKPRARTRKPKDS